MPSAPTTPHVPHVPDAGNVPQLPIAVHECAFFVLNRHTRLPFRYGIASMTALPHLFVRLLVEVGGRRHVGIAAEGLPPKWFTKDPDTTFRQDLDDMLRCIHQAADLARAVGPCPTVFDWWQQVDAAQRQWGAQQGYPPLLSGLGTSLMERAVLDAFCRASGQPFAEAVRANTLGISLGAIHAPLAGTQPADFLPAQPLRRASVRHTVGLSDPLMEGDIPPAERLDDGLPQSLEASIRAYGLDHFKVKLSGDLPRDIARLRQLSVVLGLAGEGYAFTLDGNEQYHEVDAFRQAWETLRREPSLRPFWPHLLFVEQPLHRAVALSAETARALLAWPDRPALIIDESDGEAESLPLALAGGYAGTSYKSCKGVLRGLANAGLIAHRRATLPGAPAILSGEDLATIGPYALLQDLAVMATLGITHIERNGHHYFAGLSTLPEAMQRQVLERHGDLYRRHPDGYPTLRIEHGSVALDSVVTAPFGADVDLLTEAFTPLSEWRFESLGLVE